MAILQGRFEREAYLSRIGLFFNGVGKKLTIKDLSRYGNTKCFSFFILPKSSSTNNTFIKKGASFLPLLNITTVNHWTFIVMTPDGVNYYDGQYNGLFNVPSNADWSVTDDWVLFEDSDCYIANFAMWDKNLSQSESVALGQLGGAIPSGLRSNLLGYWTMQHYPYKDLSNIYGFGAGETVIFDSVGMFGVYASNHGRLEGFSDSEIGSSNRSSAVSIVDFYSKTTPYLNALNIEEGTYFQGVLPVPSVIGYDRDFAMIFDSQVFSRSNVNLWNMGNVRGGMFMQFRSTFLDFRLEYSGGSNDYRFSLPSLKVGVLQVYAMSFNSSTKEISFYLNGDMQNISLPVFEAVPSGGAITDLRLYLGALFNTSTQGPLRASFMRLYDRQLSHDELRFSGVRQPLDAVANFSLNEVSGNSFIEVIGSGAMSNTGLSMDSQLHGSGLWLEKESGFPSLDKALLIQSSNSIRKSVNDCVGIGFTVKLNGVVSSVSDIVLGTGAISRFFLNGIEYSDESSLVTALNKAEWAHIDLVMISTGGSIEFMNSGVDYYLGRHYYLKEAITLAEHARSFGNGFFQNPKLSEQDKYSHYFQCMEGSFIGNVENRDLLGGQNAVVVGYPDLNGVRNACVEIQELRF